MIVFLNLHLNPPTLPPDGRETASKGPQTSLSLGGRLRRLKESSAQGLGQESAGSGLIPSTSLYDLRPDGLLQHLRYT